MPAGGHNTNIDWSKIPDEAPSGLDAGKLSKDISGVETGGDYSATNPHSSATGKYQFLWNDFGDDIRQVTGVKSKREFLTNPDAQEKYFKHHVEKNLGPTVEQLRQFNKQGYSDNQLAKLAHFKGSDGNREFLVSGTDNTSENNISIPKYIGQPENAIDWGAIPDETDPQKKSPVASENGLATSSSVGQPTATATSSPAQASAPDGVVHNVDGSESSVPNPYTGLNDPFSPMWSGGNAAANPVQIDNAPRTPAERLNSASSILANHIIENAKGGTIPEYSNLLNNTPFTQSGNPIHDATDPHGDPKFTGDYTKYGAEQLRLEKNRKLNELVASGDANSDPAYHSKVDAINSEYDAKIKDILNSGAYITSLQLANKEYNSGKISLAESDKQIEEAKKEYDKEAEVATGASDISLAKGKYERAKAEIKGRTKYDAVRLGMEQQKLLGNKTAESDIVKYNNGQPIDDESKFRYHEGGLNILEEGSKAAAANGQSAIASDINSNAEDVKGRLLKDNKKYFSRELGARIGSYLFDNESNPIFGSLFARGELSPKEVREAGKKAGLTSEQIDLVDPKDVPTTASWPGQASQAAFNTLLFQNEKDPYGQLFVGNMPKEQRQFNNWRGITGEIASGAGTVAGFMAQSALTGGALEGAGAFGDVALNAKRYETASNLIPIALSNYNNAYETSKEVIGDAPKDAVKRHVYAIVDAAIGTALMSIDPVAALGKEAIGLNNPGAKDFIKLLKNNSFEDITREEFKTGVRKFIDGAAIKSAETAKHIGTQSFIMGANKAAENVTDMVFDPEHRHGVMDNVGQAAIQAGVSMALPSLFAGIRAQGSTTPANKALLWDVGNNSRKYREEVTDLYKNGKMSADDFHTAINGIRKAATIVGVDVPTESIVSGRTLTNEQKQAYAWNLLVSDKMTDKLEQLNAVSSPDESQLKLVKDRIGELANERTEILNKAGVIAPEDRPIKAPVYDPGHSDVSTQKKSVKPPADEGSVAPAATSEPEPSVEKKTEEPIDKYHESTLPEVTADDYIAANPNLTEYDIAFIREGDEKAVAKAKEEMTKAFQYLEGDMNAEEYIHSVGYSYETKGADADEYAKKESGYWQAKYEQWKEKNKKLAETKDKNIPLSSQEGQTPKTNEHEESNGRSEERRQDGASTEEHGRENAKLQEASHGENRDEQQEAGVLTPATDKDVEAASKEQPKPVNKRKRGKIPIIQEPDLATQDLGEIKGEPEKETKQDLKEATISRPDKPADILASDNPTGESFNEAKDRFKSAIDQIAKDAPNNSVVLTHSWAIKLLQAAEKVGWDHPEIAAEHQKGSTETGDLLPYKTQDGKIIWLARHGETDDNVNNLQRTDDTPLTEKGQEQAKNIAKQLKEKGVEPSQIITSDLPRAKETSEIISKEFRATPEQKKKPAPESEHPELSAINRKFEDKKNTIAAEAQDKIEKLNRQIQERDSNTSERKRKKDYFDQANSIIDNMGPRADGGLDINNADKTQVPRLVDAMAKLSVLSGDEGMIFDFIANGRPKEIKSLIEGVYNAKPEDAKIKVIERERDDQIRKAETRRDYDYTERQKELQEERAAGEVKTKSNAEAQNKARQQESIKLGGKLKNSIPEEKMKDVSIADISELNKVRIQKRVSEGGAKENPEEESVSTMESEGIKEPIKVNVRYDPDGTPNYNIMNGNHRLEEAERLGATKVPVIVLKNGRPVKVEDFKVIKKETPKPPEVKKEEPTPAAKTITPLSTAEQNRKKGSFEREGINYVRNKKQTGPEGNEGLIEFSKGVDKPFTYQLVESDQLQTASKDGNRNPNHFIPEAQPKERKDAASKESAERIADKPDLNKVGESPNAYSGAPVVNARGEVIQGNNRAEGLNKHYDQNGESYKEQLKANAEKYGLTKEQVEEMKNPVLVRKVDVGDEEAIRLGNYDVKDIETGGKNRIDPVAASRRIAIEDKQQIIKALHLEGEDATLNAAVRNNFDKILKLLNKHLRPAQIDALTNKDKSPSSEGLQDVEKLITHFLFDKGDVNLPDHFEGLSDAAKKGLIKAFPKIFSVAEENILVPEVQNALIAHEDFKTSQNQSFNSWKAQGDMFSGGKAPHDTYTPLELKIAEALSNAKTQKEINNLFAEYAEKVNGKQGDMFGGAVEGKSKTQAIKEVFKVPYDEKQSRNERAAQEAAGVEAEVDQPQVREESVAPEKSEPVQEEKLNQAPTDERSVATKAQPEPETPSQKLSNEIDEINKKIEVQQAFLRQSESNLAKAEKSKKAEAWNEHNKKATIHEEKIRRLNEEKAKLQEQKDRIQYDEETKDRYKRTGTAIRDFGKKIIKDEDLVGAMPGISPKFVRQFIDKVGDFVEAIGNFHVAIRQAARWLEEQGHRALSSDEMRGIEDHLSYLKETPTQEPINSKYFNDAYKPWADAAIEDLDNGEDYNSIVDDVLSEPGISNQTKASILNYIDWKTKDRYIHNASLAEPAEKNNVIFGYSLKNGDAMTKMLSGETIELRTGDKPLNEQEAIKYSLSLAANDAQAMVSKMKHHFGDDVLDYGPAMIRQIDKLPEGQTVKRVTAIIGLMDELRKDQDIYENELLTEKNDKIRQQINSRLADIPKLISKAERIYQETQREASKTLNTGRIMAKLFSGKFAHEIHADEAILKPEQREQKKKFEEKESDTKIPDKIAEEGVIRKEAQADKEVEAAQEKISNVEKASESKKKGQSLVKKVTEAVTRKKAKDKRDIEEMRKDASQKLTKKGMTPDNMFDKIKDMIKKNPC